VDEKHGDADESLIIELLGGGGKVSTLCETLKV